MTSRGLPFVDGAPACPFVAFADDRDERATSPDHRHRCYAEMRPAPRALAHQEAYCLASAFPVCPTFQDWARREAARARPGPVATPEAAGRTASPGGEGGEGGDGGANAARAAGVGATGLTAGGPGAATSDSEAIAAPGFLASRDRPGGGLAGSAADRLASEGDANGAEASADAPPSFLGRASGADAAAGAAGPARRDAGEWLDEEVERQDASWPDRRNEPAAARPRREPNVHQGWDRPRRDVHATRRTRLRVPRLTGIWLAVALLLVAALVLFLAPGFLRGLGSGGAGSSPGSAAGSPSPTAAASPSASPSPSATPAPSRYVVQAGDTLSEIAQRFGVSLPVLIEANRENLPNPNNLQIGDELIIPPAGTTPAPASSATGSASPQP